MTPSRSRNFFFCLGAVLALILLWVSLPKLLFWSLCLKEDHDRPPNTEVIFSACQRPGVVGVPGGETLFVHEYRPENIYLLDLRTGEKKAVPDDPLLFNYSGGWDGVFLSSELVWLEGSISPPGDTDYRPHYILDLTTGQRYELLDLDWLPRLEGGKFDPRNYAYIRFAEQVFIHHTQNTLIALSADFRDNPNGRVILSQNSLEGGYNAEKGKLLEQLVKNLGKEYEVVDFSLRYASVPSPTGKYVVRGDGIYLSETNTRIVTHTMAGFIGWYYDESGVIIGTGGYPLLVLPGGGSFFYIPGPLLKLRLP